MYRVISILLANAWLALMVASPVQAGLIIDVQDAEINAGGTGFIDVFIRSDSSDLLDAANFQFLISPVGTPSSSLAFVDPQDDAEQFDPTYVFAGDNLGLLQFVNSAMDMEGSDLTASGSGIALGTADRLLVRLDLKHGLGTGQSAADAIGEQFEVSLFVNPSAADNLSFFEGPSGSLISILTNDFGTVTVTQPVPEPTTLSIFGLGAICLAGSRFRRK